MNVIIKVIFTDFRSNNGMLEGSGIFARPLWNLTSSS